MSVKNTEQTTLKNSMIQEPYTSTEKNPIDMERSKAIGLGLNCQKTAY